MPTIKRGFQGLRGGVEAGSLPGTASNQGYARVAHAHAPTPTSGLPIPLVRAGGSTIRVAVTTVVLLLANFAAAQDSQFVFDAPGNLLAETTEVPEPPQIEGQPQNQVVEPGHAASFSVVVADTRGLSYQWQFMGTNIGGATGDAVLLQNVGTANEGEYQVVLTNPSGSVTSAPAMLGLDANGNGMPDSWELTYFGNLTNTASGDFDGDGVPNLQEFLDGTNPTNAASALYHLTIVSDGGAVGIIPDQPAYTNGQTVTLTANPPPAGVFYAWTGDVVSRSNTLTLNMTTNKTLYAHFTPMTFQWTSGASGDWSVGANWTPPLPPGTNDTVQILEGVTVTLNTNVSLKDFTFGSSVSSPTLAGSGTLEVQGAFTWTAGSLSGNGRTVIDPGATLNIVTPGTISLFNGTLENGGTVLCKAASWQCAGAIITNRAAAFFVVQSPLSLFDYNPFIPTPSRFDNAGTFLISVSTGTMSIGANFGFNNYGVAEIQSGTLTLAGGGENDGTMDVPADSALNLSGGTFTSTSDSTLTGAGKLTVSGATANLAGVVNLSNTNTFSGGTANLTGDYICTNNTVVISGGTANFSGTGTVSPAEVDLSSGTLGGPQVVTIDQEMNWNGGWMTDSGATVIRPGATLNIGNSAPIALYNRTLENGGTVLCQATSWNCTGGVITNRSGASFEVQSPLSLFWYSPSIQTPSRFDNAGIFRKSTSTGAMNISANVAFNNYGTADIETGTLGLGGGGLNAGTMSFPTGTLLNLYGGTFTSTASSSVTGDGQLSVNGATANLVGLVDLNGTNSFNNGTANLTGDYFCTNNTLNIFAAGTANFNGTGLVAPAVLNLIGTLGGSNTVTVGVVLNWTGGGMDGGGVTVIPPGATASVANNGSTIFTSGRTLENEGTLLWTGGGNWVCNNGSVITNLPGALFEVQSAPLLYWPNGGFGRLDNAGIFRKSTSTGAMNISANVAFNNYGTADIQTGTLGLGGGGLNAGAMSFPTGTLLNLYGGTFTSTASSSITGAGRLTVSGATANLAGLVNMSGTNTFSSGTANLTGDYICTNNTLVISGATANLSGTGTVAPAEVDLSNILGGLTGSQVVTVGSVMNWTSGGMSGSGMTIISPGATLNIANTGNTISMSGRTLENGGTILWTGSGNWAFNNGGVITNRPGGLFEVQSAPLLYWPNGGSSRFDNAGKFRKSVSTGTMSVSANIGFHNYGTLDLQAGLVSAGGGYTCTSNAVVDCAIGGTNVSTGYARLQVSGSVTLHGALNVNFINGFIPTTNDTFTVLTAGTRNGAFDNFYYPSNDVTMQLSNTTTSVILSVSDVHYVPQPVLLPPELVPPDVKLTWTAVSNITYRVEFNPTLNPSNWDAVPGDVISVSNTASKLDALTTSNQFYRVRVLP